MKKKSKNDTQKDKIIKKYFTQLDENRQITTTKDKNALCLNTRFRTMPLFKKIDNYVLENGEDRLEKSTKDNDECAYNNYRIRKLTPIECERLQSFPDGWTELGKDGEPISNTQRYKCLGNAVTTSVITFVINRMFQGLNEEES